MLIFDHRSLLTDVGLLSVLLKDHSTNGNIFWATYDYAQRGVGYQFFDQIAVDAITGENENVIVPRAMKSRQRQQQRVREKAEVFTPSWLCNHMCNLVDNVWFNRENVFNTEINEPGKPRAWKPSEGKIEFPEGKTWRDYVSDNRLEITCGEVPFLVSRYDAVSGERLPVEMRIGFLDRKLRVVGENTGTPDEWLEAAKAALRSTYGYEWQGDNLLLARENFFYTILDYYWAKFKSELHTDHYHDLAYIISWNLWQMDGLKGVIPRTCHDEIEPQKSIFADEEPKKTPCPGCKYRDFKRHNGIPCIIMDWETGKSIEFRSLIKNGKGI